ncbi:MAG: RNA polymerase factor sigma-54 [Paludibacteraceae bacterium]|nr:RNA polymerase factor sigma-54 [Paludibacteraceae bacterium]
MAQKQLQIQKQTQNISPQQLMVVGMLSCNVEEIEERIKKELEENPALEKAENLSDVKSSSEGETYNADEDYYTGEYSDESDYKEGEKYDEMGDFSNLGSDGYDYYDDYSSDSGYSEESYNPQSNLTEETSFTDSLLEQIEFQNLSKVMKALCSYIIGNLDESGYLHQEIPQMTEDLNIKLGLEITETQMLEALLVVQSLDPAGVGARDLQECLTIQLSRKPETENVDNAIMIVEEAFDEFKSRQVDKISKKFSISRQQVKDAFLLISHLNPKPGNGFSAGGMMKNESVIPDFIYDNETDTLSLNSKGIPSLNVSKEYIQMLEDFKGNPKNRTKNMRESIQFTKQKLDRAKIFIDAIKQRENTLLMVMRTIIDFQKEFFKEEDESNLKPLTMREVSEVADCDISTVSRVVSSKYIQTNAGIYSLKEFFSVKFNTESGEEVSSRKIKVILKEIINSEDKTKPLSDGEISKKLAERGLLVARRTVAKYREQMSIPVGRIRKEL